MRRIAFWLVLVVLAAASGALVLLSRGGFSARREPSAVEAYVARRFRLLAIPWSARKVENPLPATPEVIAEVRGHYADHCAICRKSGRSVGQVGGVVTVRDRPLCSFPALVAAILLQRLEGIVSTETLTAFHTYKFSQ